MGFSIGFSEEHPIHAEPFSKHGRLQGIKDSWAKRQKHTLRVADSNFFFLFVDCQSRPISHQLLFVSHRKSEFSFLSAVPVALSGPAGSSARCPQGPSATRTAGAAFSAPLARPGG